MISKTYAASAVSRGLLLIAVAATLWGTVGVATRGVYELAPTNALSIGFFRLAFATPALLVACRALCGPGMFRIAWRDLGTMALVGAAMALYQVCLFSAIPLVGVSVAVVVTLCTAPVIVAIASIWLFREPVTLFLVLALGCAVVGTLLLVGDAPAAVSTTAAVQGVLLALGSACGYALIALWSRSLARRYHPLQTITVGFGAGALLLLPFALATGLVVSYPLAGWALLIHLGLVPTALGYTLYLFGMRTVTATTASLVTLIEPLTAALLSWILFSERLSTGALFGSVLLLGAMLLLYIGETRRAALVA